MKRVETKLPNQRTGVREANIALIETKDNSIYLVRRCGVNG